MGFVADRLDSMVIRVTSPDGRFEAVYRAVGGVGLDFHDDCYRRYDEASLQRQLTQVANRLWQGYHRAYDMVLEEASGTKPTPAEQTWDARRRRFLNDRAETVFEGMSAEANVFIQTTGMRDWHVILRDGVLSRLDESAFIAEVSSSFTALTSDCRSKTARLRAKHYRAVR